MTTIENEELMEQLQRVSVLARRGKRSLKKSRMIDENSTRKIDENSSRKIEGGHREGHRSGRNAVAFGDVDAAHGYGNHRCHGGSGRHGQNRVLAVLSLQEGINQKELAYLLGIRPQSLGEALSKLEEAELIRREQDDSDKRAVKVYLTESGKARSTKVTEDRKKTASDIFEVLSDEEKEQLASIFGKLTVSIEERFAQATA